MAKNVNTEAIDQTIEEIIRRVDEKYAYSDCLMNMTERERANLSIQILTIIDKQKLSTDERKEVITWASRQYHI